MEHSSSTNASQHELLRERGLERHAEQLRKHEKDMEEHKEKLQAHQQRWQALRARIHGTRRQEETGVADAPAQSEEGEIESGGELRELESQVQTMREALGMSAGEGEVDRLREESSLRLKDFLSTWKQCVRELAKIEETIRETVQHVLTSPRLESATSAWSEVASLQGLRDEIVHALEEELPQRDPESFLAHSLLKLRQYKKELPSGIVETSDIKKLKDTIVEKLAKQRLVALVGETGTGKTRLSRKIAEELTGGYEFIAGHAFLTKEDLLYYLNLSPQEVRSEDVPRLAEEAKVRFRALNPDAPEEELAAQFAMVEGAELGKAEQKTLQMETLLGPAFRAAEAGKILIYDEFNFSPPELLAGLYQLMEAKPGEKIMVMGKEITVAPGFGIIFTGNITQADLQRYFNRKEMDPAFVNRLNSGLIEYNTPPQEHNLNLTTSILSQEDLANGQESPRRNLFLIGLAHLIDIKGNLVAPEGALDQLWLLSMKFSILQKIFAGQQLQQFTPASGTRFNLNKYHASLRTFGAVLEQWKQDGFRYDLDWYLYNNLLRPSALISPSETAQFFYLLKDANAGFFQQDAWNRLQVDTNDWSMNGWEEAKQVSRESLRSSATKKHFLPQEVAEAAAGARMPEFPEEAASAEAQEAGEDREHMEEYRELERMIEAEEHLILEEHEGLAYSIKRFCEDEAAIMGREEAA